MTWPQAVLYVGGHPCQGQVFENRVGSKDSGVVQIHFCRELLLKTQGPNDKTICQSEARHDWLLGEEVP